MMIHPIDRILLLLCFALSVGNASRANEFNRVPIVDVTREIAADQGPASCPLEVEYGPNGKQLAVRIGTQKVEIWDTQTWTRSALWNTKLPVEDMCFADGGRQLCTATEKGIVSRDFSTNTYYRLSSFPATLVREHADRMLTAFGPDGWSQWDIDKPMKLPVPTSGGVPVFVDPEGKRLFLCRTHNNNVDGRAPVVLSVLETDTSMETMVARLNQFPSAVRLVPTLGGSSVFVSAPSEGVISTYSYAMDQVVGRREGSLGPHPAGVVDFDISSDERFLIAATKTGVLTLWELQSRQRVLEFNTVGAPVHCVRFAPNRNDFAVAYGQTMVTPPNVWGAVRTGSIQRAILYSYGPTADNASARQVAAKTMLQLWDDLASPKIAEAYAAVAHFSTNAADLESLNRRILDTLQQPTEDEIQARIRQLDSPDFELREAATKALIAWGAILGDRLDEALENASSIEARLRLRRIFDRMRGGALLADTEDDRYRQFSRALYVLSQSADPAARSTLEKVQAWHPDPLIRYYAGLACRQPALSLTGEPAVNSPAQN